MSIKTLKPTDIGYSSLQETEIQPLSISDILIQIVKLNDAPIEFIQKNVEKRIRDMLITPLTELKCKYGDKDSETCNTIRIEFEILFDADIVGFRSFGSSYTDQNRTKLGTSISKYFIPTNFARKAGQMYLSLIYIHHIMPHKTKNLNNPYKFKFSRSPFNLNLLPYDLSNNTNNILVKRHLENLHNYSLMKPTIKNHKEYRSLYQRDIVHNLHKDVLCTDKSHISIIQGIANGTRENSSLNCVKYHLQDDYCRQHCKVVDVLFNFHSHPQYMGLGSESYCVGNLKNNQDATQSIMTRNVFQYIGNFIRGMIFVNPSDCRGGIEYFHDVFVKSRLLFKNDTASSLVNRLGSLVSEYGSMNLRSDHNMKFLFKNSLNHIFTINCYCKNCLNFLIRLARGLKYDNRKLIIGKGAIITKDNIKFLMEEIDQGGLNYSSRDIIAEWIGAFDINNKRVRSVNDFFETIFTININDPKYHINISKYDFTNFMIMTGMSANNIPRYFDNNLGIFIGNNFKDDISRKASKFFDLKAFLINNRILFNKLKTDGDLNSLVTEINKVKIDPNISLKTEPYHPDQSKEDWKRVKMESKY